MAVVSVCRQAAGGREQRAFSRMASESLTALMRATGSPSSQLQQYWQQHRGHCLCHRLYVSLLCSLSVDFTPQKDRAGKCLCSFPDSLQRTARASLQISQCIASAQP